jgi:hypothetical protein
MLNLPSGSPKSVERQVDLIFAILTDEPALDAPPIVERSGEPMRLAKAAEPVGDARKENNVAPEAARIEQLEVENLHLKQLVGSLSLEKKLLLERLAALEPAAATTE